MPTSNPTMMKLFTLLAASVVQSASSDTPEIGESSSSYGADVSFPVHHKDVAPGPLGDRQKVYDDFMSGCRAHFANSPQMCDRAEQDRIGMAVRQPAGMVNYTETGYRKVAAPADVFATLKSYWENNQASVHEEEWYGYTYVNHWTAPTRMLNVGESKLRGGEGQRLKQSIWDGIKPVLEEWTGMELEPSCDQMGIREYTEGAMFAPHADRQPLISSVIMNIAQDVDEEWPLEVIGRDGVARNVTMQPGEMVMYESASLVHGRPFALKGKSYANIFIHFQPTGKLLRERPTPVRTEKTTEGLPIYIREGSAEAEHWLREHGTPSVQTQRKVQEVPASTGPRQAIPQLQEKLAKRKRGPSISGSSGPVNHNVNAQHPHVSNRDLPAPTAASALEGTIAHAASTGDVRSIVQFAKRDKSKLQLRDHNGWAPIHLAARGGHLDAVQFFVYHGANVNERTNFGEGKSCLDLVMEYHGREHPLYQYLTRLGAKP